jgi:ferredoxin
MDLKYREILTGDGPLGRYPLHLLKRVDLPTNRYEGEIERRAPSEGAFMRARAGEYGEKIREGILKFNTREPIVATLSAVEKYLSEYPLPEVAPVKAPISDDPHILARHIKAFAYFLGADMVGICRLPQSAVYTTDTNGTALECEYKYAVVLLNVKHKETVRSTYGREWIDDPCSFGVYQKCALQAQDIAEYIRRLGWPADSSVLRKYATLMPQLVIESGLGEASRMGIALNPFVGASFKVSAVLTDLPLETDRPIDFGLQDYCANCKICAEQCPVQAIPYGEKEIYNGYETWPLNYKNCVIGIATNKIGNICQRCTKVCPWNRPDNRPEDLLNWDGSIESLHASVNRQAERMRQNGYREPEEYTDKWWFPLVEDESGNLTEGPEFDY